VLLARTLPLPPKAADTLESSSVIEAEIMPPRLAAMAFQCPLVECVDALRTSHRAVH
jgi:hypothetical protein